MSLKMSILALILVGTSNQLLAQEAPSPKCYNAKNPSDLTISIDFSQTTEKARSALLVYTGAETTESKKDSLVGSDINIHAFSQSIYYTSLGIGYNQKYEMYVGDCNAGYIEAQFENEGHLLKLSSKDGYRGVALIKAVCSNATLKFDKPIEFEQLDDHTCKQQLNKLPVLPEQEIE